MIRIKKISFVLLVIMTIIVSIILYFYKFSNTIVVVNSDKVLQEYYGFKEAKDAYELKVEKFSKQFLKQREFYDNEVKKYQENKSELTSYQEGKKEEELNLYKLNLTNLGKKIEKKIEEEEKKILKGVYNKIDDFISRYAKKRKIDLVLGTAKGNTLYVGNKMDVTEDVIKCLNEEYLNGVKY